MDIYVNNDVISVRFDAKVQNNLLGERYREIEIQGPVFNIGPDVVNREMLYNRRCKTEPRTLTKTINVSSTFSK